MAQTAFDLIRHGRKPTVALLPWGDVIEDFLDTIGVSFQSFCEEMSGGWLFGYVEALKSAGIDTVLVCFSERVHELRRTIHKRTGARVSLLPASRLYRGARRSNGLGSNPNGRQRLLKAFRREITPFLATPLRVLAREIRHQSCDFILCQEYEYPRFDACVLVGRWLGVPVFATFQGGDWQMSRLERPLRPLTVRACDGLIVGSEEEARRVRHRYGVPPQKLARIFNPIDLSIWHRNDRTQARAELGLHPETKVAVWHGRVDVRRKGLDILIDAWSRLCRERPGAALHLLLVGTGQDAAGLRNRIELLKLKNVTWIDRYLLDQAAIRRYLAAADVYVFPSRHEGFPVALIEAMACALPVIATDAHGVSDILEDREFSGGIVVPLGDPAALSVWLGRLLDDDVLARELGIQARRRVEACFSVAAVGEQLRDFFSRRGVGAE